MGMKKAILGLHTRQHRMTMISSSKKREEIEKRYNFNNVSVMPLIVIFPLHE